MVNGGHSSPQGITTELSSYPPPHFHKSIIPITFKITSRPKYLDVLATVSKSRTKSVMFKSEIKVYLPPFSFLTCSNLSVQIYPFYKRKGHTKKVASFTRLFRGYSQVLVIRDRSPQDVLPATAARYLLLPGSFCCWRVLLYVVPLRL